jgi:hypothetical protein
LARKRNQFVERSGVNLDILSLFQRGRAPITGCDIKRSEARRLNQGMGNGVLAAAAAN